MTPDAATLRVIAGWLANLADLVRHGEARPDKDQVALYVTMLAEELLAGAFTPASLRHVAGAMVWWPAYADLVRQLNEWWRDHKPPTAPMIGCDSGPAAALTGMDAHWLAYYQRRLAGLTGDPLTAERRAKPRQPRALPKPGRLARDHRYGAGRRQADGRADACRATGHRGRGGFATAASIDAAAPDERAGAGRAASRHARGRPARAAGARPAPGDPGRGGRPGRSRPAGRGGDGGPCSPAPAGARPPDAALA